MKNKYLLIFLSLGITFNVIAQRPESGSGTLTTAQLQALSFPSSFKTTALSCLPNAVLNTCNYISNNSFATSVIPYDVLNPFGLDQVNAWGTSHGTPQLWYNNTFMSSLPTIPVGYGNYSIMAFADDGTSLSEGMVTKIPPLLIGNKYTFSFFERFMFLSGLNLSQFNVFLIKCSDYSSFNHESEFIPNLPSNRQQIYCETNCTNTSSWGRVVTNFIANDNYDMIWIFPKANVGTNASGLAFFAKPELINATTYSISMSPSTPSTGNCFVTLIPSGCPINNATIIWTGPNGQTYNSLTHVVNTDDPSNVGIWTATQFIPNISATNNSCGLPFSVSVNINVPSCNAPCINLPLIH